MAVQLIKCFPEKWLELSATVDEFEDLIRVRVDAPWRISSTEELTRGGARIYRNGFDLKTDKRRRQRPALMPNAGDKGSTQGDARILEVVNSRAEGQDVPSTVSTFDESELLEFTDDLKLFWPSAIGALHRLAPQDNAVSSISVLLDFAIAVFKAANSGGAVELFTLQEEAFQVLPLTKVQRLITYLELRRTEWVEFAQGEASIVLLRTGRTLLNRFEPRLHAWETGRIIAYLALSKGMAHPSRVNRKGLSYSGGPQPAPGEKLSVEYAVAVLQNPTKLAASPDLEQFLSDVLHRLTRLTLGTELQEMANWATLTWEETEKTVNGLIFVFVLLFALPAIKKIANESALRLVERLENRIDQIINGLDLSATVDRLMARESEWSTWRQHQYSKSEKTPVELPSSESTERGELDVPPLKHSLGNENLTRLWSVGTGLDRFKETVDWEARANEFEAKGLNDPSFKFLALRCRPWTELASTFANTPEEEYDMTEWEAKLPKEQPVPPREPTKRMSEQPEPAPKRARLAYEDAERGNAVDRQRAMTSTARPLPY